MKKVLRLKTLLGFVLFPFAMGMALAAGNVTGNVNGLHLFSRRDSRLNGTVTSRIAGEEPLSQRSTRRQARESQEVMVTKFFHLVNETGAEIKVQVLADGKELFAKRMEAALEPSRGIVHPATQAFPSLELKISISQQAKQLTVKETLHLKKRRSFTISASSEKADAGFQIVLNRDGIAVTQDYYPAR